VLDPKLFHKDPNARSLSFFSAAATSEVSDALVTNLVEESERNGRCNARICLHAGPDSNFHEMIILERDGSYFPPHRHVGKAQSCHILWGAAAVFVFDDDGSVERCCHLGSRNKIIRIAENRYHLTLPLSEYVVYHECKPGPFLPTGDSIFAEWAPARDDKAAVTSYVDGLLSRIR
jgi:cupin fold WbuC family metalloprotein